MVSKAKYDQVGGLDQNNLAIAYNDIDFCLRLMDCGYMNLFTPHCKATHYDYDPLVEATKIMKKNCNASRKSRVTF